MMKNPQNRNHAETMPKPCFHGFAATSMSYAEKPSKTSTKNETMSVFKAETSETMPKPTRNHARNLRPKPLVAHPKGVVPIDGFAFFAIGGASKMTPQKK